MLFVTDSFFHQTSQGDVDQWIERMTRNRSFMSSSLIKGSSCFP